MDVSKLISKYKSSKSECAVNIHSFESPVGNVVAIADNDYLYLLSFEDTKNLENKIKTVHTELSCSFEEGENKILKKLKDEMNQYFDGKLKKFTVPLKMLGSEFQKQVWDKILELPYGSTQTYGDLASSLGRSSSHARAIGAACGANSHLLIVPCHRLVAAGSKDGYNSGVDRKDKLLLLEKKYT